MKYVLDASVAIKWVISITPRLNFSVQSPSFA